MTGRAPEPLPESEREAFDLACRHAFHEDGDPEEVALDVRTLEPERSLLVRDGSEIVATAAVVSRRMTVPGAVLPVAAVTAVGVLPGHTRRGHLGRLMRRQLDDVRAAGRESVAVLWASEPGIYGRYGYGPASRSARYEVRLAAASLRADVPRPAERPRLLAPADALPAMTAVFEAVRPGRPGVVDRTEPWWERRLLDPEHRRDGAGARRAVVQRGPDGEPAGYALYAATQSRDEQGPSGEVRIRELVATTPEATAGLWGYFLGLDLMRTVLWRLAPERDPLPHLLVNADVVAHRTGDGLWIRLVDVDRALAARTYSAPVSLVLEVDDAFCPWNAGRHRLVADGDAIRCEPTGEPADLALGAEALGAAYLGGTTLRELAAAGRVRELRPGALDAASVAFRGAVEPWCPEVF